MGTPYAILHIFYVVLCFRIFCVFVGVRGRLESSSHLKKSLVLLSAGEFISFYCIGNTWPAVSDSARAVHFVTELLLTTFGQLNSVFVVTTYISQVEGSNCSWPLSDWQEDNNLINSVLV